MGMNETPAAERTVLAFFGKRNVGKSSLVNAVVGQEVSVVSDVKGTTTDPVSKTMELLPLGPVVIIDTPGFDDEGMLGEKRVKRTLKVLERTDIAVLVIDASVGMTSEDEDLLKLIQERGLPYIIAANKSDLGMPSANTPEKAFPVSAQTGARINEFKDALAALKPQDTERPLIADKLAAGDFVVLVVPIDEAAPKGRLILPQQQTIREVIESNAIALVTRPSELKSLLERLPQEPKIVITDSQAFAEVSAVVPRSCLLTSFSILMARKKGFLQEAVKSVAAVRSLQDGDRVLIAEGCTHHRQCGDIGSVKIPGWLRRFSNKAFEIEFCSGMDFPEDLSPYKVVIHCGGCMLTERVVQNRKALARLQNVPFTNYGILIAFMNGIFERSLEVFPNLF